MTTAEPNLDCLSLDELEHLLSVLGAMADAGRQLDMACLNPVFSLTPGRRMVVSIEAMMPRSARLDARQSRITLTGTPVEDRALTRMMREAAGEYWRNKYADQRDEAAQVEGASDQTADGAASEAPAAEPAPPPAREPEPGPVSPFPAGEAAGASSSLSPAADPFAPPHPPSEIEAHLLTLPRCHGHSLEDDLQLLQLTDAGWQPGEIAAELGLDAKAVGQRWDALSGLDRDTKQRRWTRAALIEALEGLCSVRGDA